MPKTNRRGDASALQRQVTCTMTRQERLDVGEKIFVGAFIGAVVLETLLTIFAVSFTPSLYAGLTTVLFGAAFVGVLLFLANWLYSGDLTAWKSAVGFGGFQLVLSVGVLIVFLVG